MMKIAEYSAAGIILVLSTAVFADKHDEIRHLLSFVEQSGCEFERNGKVYESEKARSHMEIKYDYVDKYVDETEDFIKYAATESSMSGRKYQVICDGKKQASAEWLKGELSRYRTVSHSAAVSK